MPFTIFTDSQHNTVPCIHDPDQSMYGTIIYRVPTKLIDFIKLPLVLSHNRRMIMSILVLSRHLRIRDVVIIIITLATHAHHDLDYAQYCEKQVYPVGGHD